jgi:hypothetical protein
LYTLEPNHQVIAMSHFPLYYRATPLDTTGVPVSRFKVQSLIPYLLTVIRQAVELAQQALEEMMPLAQQPWIVAEECEFPDENGWSHSKTCRPKGWNKTTKDADSNGDSNADAGTAADSDPISTAGGPPGIPGAMQRDLEPIFDRYGVDIYWAGHIHFYQTFDGPVRKGKVLSNGALMTTRIHSHPHPLISASTHIRMNSPRTSTHCYSAGTHNPRGVIHVCTGNGGPPSATSCLQVSGR